MANGMGLLARGGSRERGSFVDSWLPGCGGSSSRRRLFAILRAAHRELGLGRKRLGLGLLGNGAGVRGLYAGVAGLAIAVHGSGLAQIVPDGSTATGVARTANDTPLINVAAPDGGGLSHNRFNELNTGERGVVINNSKVDGVSEIGGHTLKNPNLRSHGSATAILAEVTGPGASQLGGTLEIFGGKADLLIANPNGVTLDGVSVLNVNGLTVTTGRPAGRTESGGVRFDARTGTIDIGAGGVNSSGLSYFDLVARAIQLRGQVAGDEGAKGAPVTAIAGVNSYDSGTRSHAPLDGVAASGAIGIGGTAAGALFGRDIVLVSTEQGVGVRQPGMIGSAQDIRVTANGDVELVRADAGRNIAISGTDVSLGGAAGRAAGGVTARGDVRVTARGHLATADDVIGRSATLRGESVALSGDILATDGALDVAAAKNLTLAGDLVALDTQGAPIAGAMVRFVNGRHRAYAADGSEISAAHIGSTTRLASGRAVMVQAGSLDNRGGAIAATSGASAMIEVAGAVRNAGRIMASGGGDLAVTAGDGSANTGEIYSDKGVRLTLGGTLEHGGAIAGEHVAISSAAGKPAALRTTATGLIRATTAAMDVASVENAGRILTDRILSVQATGSLANTGQVQAGEGLSLAVAGDVSNAGAGASIRSGGTLALDAGSLRNEEGRMHAAGDARVTVAGDARNVGGWIASEGKLAVTAHGDLVNERDAAIGGKAVTIAVDGAATNRGASLITATDDLDLSAGDGVLNSGEAVISASKRARLASRKGSVRNQDGAEIGGETVSIDAARDVVNAGKARLVALGGLDVAAGGKLINADAAAIGGKSVRIVSGEVDNRDAASIEGADALSLKTGRLANRRKAKIGAGGAGKDGTPHSGALTLGVTGDLENSDGAQIGSTEGAAITVDGALANLDDAIVHGRKVDLVVGGGVTNADGARLLGSDSLLLQAGSLVNRDKALVGAGGRGADGSVRSGDVELVLDGAVRNAGGATIAATRGLTLAAGGAVGNETGATISARSVDLQAKASVSNAGLIAAAENLYLGATALTNAGSGRVEAARVNVRVSDRFDNSGSVKGTDKALVDSVRFGNSGQITAGRELGIAAQSYANRGQIVSLGAATLSLPGDREVRLSSMDPLPQANGVLTLNSGSLVIDERLENPGSMVLNAKGDIRNEKALISGGSIQATAEGGVINSAGSLIWAEKDIAIKAARLDNEAGAQITASRDLAIYTSGKVTNRPGARLAAGGNMWIDARELVNEARLEGDVSVASSQAAHGEHNDYHSARHEYYRWSISGIAELVSDFTATRGVIEAGGGLSLNQGGSGLGSWKGKGAQVVNRGLVQAVGDIRADGDIYNLAASHEEKLSAYLDRPIQAELYARPYSNINTPLDDGGAHSFDSLRQVLDFVFQSDGVYGRSPRFDYPLHSEQAINTLKQAAGSAMLDQIFQQILGADWKAQGRATLQGRWQAYKGEEGKRQGLLFYPDSETEIAAGGHVIQAGGRVFNGDTHVRQAEQALVQVQVGGKQVDTVRGDLGVRVNERDLAAGLDASSAILSLLGNGFLFRKRDLPAAPDALGAPAASLGGEAAPDAGGRVPLKPDRPTTVPLYETDLKYIDQSRFFGSDYFLKAVNYDPQRTLNVIGDAYFDTKLIARQIERSVGGALLVRDGLAETDRVKRLIDNGADYRIKLGLVVGAAPTSQQLGKAPDNFVWYVWQNVDGRRVLAPIAYIVKGKTDRNKASDSQASKGAIKEDGQQDLVGRTAGEAPADQRAAPVTAAVPAAGPVRTLEERLGDNAARRRVAGAGAALFARSADQAAERTVEQAAFTVDVPGPVEGPVAKAADVADRDATARNLADIAKKKAEGIARDAAAREALLSAAEARDAARGARDVANALKGARDSGKAAQAAKDAAAAADAARIAAEAAQAARKGGKLDEAEAKSRDALQASKKADEALKFAKSLLQEERKRQGIVDAERDDAIGASAQKNAGKGSEKKKAEVAGPAASGAKAARVVAEADRRTGSASIRARGDVTIEADANGIANFNGIIASGGKTAIKSQGAVANVAVSGFIGGLASHGLTSIDAQGDVLNSGASIVGGDVRIKSTGRVTDSARLGFDASGKQIIANQGGIVGTAKGGSVVIDAAKDANFIASDVRADNISVKAGGSLTSTDLHVTASDYRSKTRQALLGYEHMTDMKGASIAQGSRLNAGETLVLLAGADVNLQGGEYSGQTGSIQAGRDVNMLTSQNVSHQDTKTVREEFILQGNAGLAGYGAQGEVSTLDGGFGGVVMDGKVVSTRRGTGRHEASGEGTGKGGEPASDELAAARFGYQRTETTTVDAATWNEKAQLNFDSGLKVQAGHAADLGGVDIDGRNGDVSVTAGRIRTTKYEDVAEHSTDEKKTFLGIKTEGHSSIADTVNHIGQHARNARDGVEIDPGMTAVQAIGDVTNLVFGDTIGGSVNLQIQHEATKADETSRREIVGTIAGSNVRLTSTEGDMRLAGVNMAATKEAVLDSANKIDIASAKTQTQSRSDYQMHQASVGLTAGANAASASGYVGATLSYNGAIDKSRSNALAHSNSQISGGSGVTIRSAGDTVLRGAHVKAKDVLLDVGGDLRVESVQDESHMAHERGDWGASADVDIGLSGQTIGRGDVGLGANGGYGKDWDKSRITAEQSSVLASNSLKGVVRGDLRLKGATVGSQTAQGSLQVQGETVAEQLQDVHEKDGGYAGLGVGVGLGSTAKYRPSVDLSAERVDQAHKKETIRSTVAVAGFSSAGGVTGHVNTDLGATRKVTEDRKVGAVAAAITIDTEQIGEGLGKVRDKRQAGQGGGAPAAGAAKPKPTTRPLPGQSDADRGTAPGDTIVPEKADRYTMNPPAARGDDPSSADRIIIDNSLYDRGGSVPLRAVPGRAGVPGDMATYAEIPSAAVAGSAYEEVSIRPALPPRPEGGLLRAVPGRAGVTGDTPTYAEIPSAAVAGSAHDNPSNEDPSIIDNSLYDRGGSVPLRPVPGRAGVAGDTATYAEIPSAAVADTVDGARSVPPALPPRPNAATSRPLPGQSDADRGTAPGDTIVPEKADRYTMKPPAARGEDPGPGGINGSVNPGLRGRSVDSIGPVREVRLEPQLTAVGSNDPDISGSQPYDLLHRRDPAVVLDEIGVSRAPESAAQPYDLLHRRDPAVVLDEIGVSRAPESAAQPTLGTSDAHRSMGGQGTTDGYDRRIIVPLTDPADTASRNAVVEEAAWRLQAKHPGTSVIVRPGEAVPQNGGSAKVILIGHGAEGAQGVPTLGGRTPEEQAATVRTVLAPGADLRKVALIGCDSNLCKPGVEAVFRQAGERVPEVKGVDDAVAIDSSGHKRPVPQGGPSALGGDDDKDEHSKPLKKRWKRWAPSASPETGPQASGSGSTEGATGLGPSEPPTRSPSSNTPERIVVKLRKVQQDSWTSQPLMAAEGEVRSGEGGGTPGAGPSGAQGLDVAMHRYDNSAPILRNSREDREERLFEALRPRAGRVTSLEQAVDHAFKNGEVNWEALELDYREQGVELDENGKRSIINQVKTWLGWTGEKRAENWKTDLFKVTRTADGGADVLANGDIRRGEVLGPYGGVWLRDQDQLNEEFAQYGTDNVNYYRYDAGENGAISAFRAGNVLTLIGAEPNERTNVSIITVGSINLPVYVASRPIPENAPLRLAYTWTAAAPVAPGVDLTDRDGSDRPALGQHGQAPGAQVQKAPNAGGDEALVRDAYSSVKGKRKKTGLGPVSEASPVSLASVLAPPGRAARPVEADTKYAQRVIVPLGADATVQNAVKQIYDRHPDNSVVLERDGMGSLRPVAGRLHAAGGPVKVELVGHGAENGAAAKLGGLSAAEAARTVIAARDAVAAQAVGAVEVAKVSTVGCNTSGCGADDFAHQTQAALGEQGVTARVKGYEGAIDLTADGHKRAPADGSSGLMMRGQAGGSGEAPPQGLAAQAALVGLEDVILSIPDPQAERVGAAGSSAAHEDSAGTSSAMPGDTAPRPAARRPKYKRVTAEFLRQVQAMRAADIRKAGGLAGLAEKNGMAYWTLRGLMTEDGKLTPLGEKKLRGKEHGGSHARVTPAFLHEIGAASEARADASAGMDDREALNAHSGDKARPVEAISRPDGIPVENWEKLPQTVKVAFRFVLHRQAESGHESQSSFAKRHRISTGTLSYYVSKDGEMNIRLRRILKNAGIDITRFSDKARPVEAISRPDGMSAENWEKLPPTVKAAFLFFLHRQAKGEQSRRSFAERYGIGFGGLNHNVSADGKMNTPLLKSLKNAGIDITRFNDGARPVEAISRPDDMPAENWEKLSPTVKAAFLFFLHRQAKGEQSRRSFAERYGICSGGLGHYVSADGKMNTPLLKRLKRVGIDIARFSDGARPAESISRPDDMPADTGVDPGRRAALGSALGNVEMASGDALERWAARSMSDPAMSGEGPDNRIDGQMAGVMVSTMEMEGGAGADLNLRHSPQPGPSRGSSAADWRLVDIEDSGPSLSEGSSNDEPAIIYYKLGSKTGPIKQEPQEAVSPRATEEPADAPVKSETQALPLLPHEFDNRLPIFQGTDGEDVMLRALQPHLKEQRTDDLGALIAQQAVMDWGGLDQDMDRAVSALKTASDRIEKKKFLRQKIAADSRAWFSLSADDRVRRFDAIVRVVDVPDLGRGLKAERDIEAFEVLGPYAGLLVTKKRELGREFSLYSKPRVSSYLFFINGSKDVLSGCGHGNCLSMANESNDPDDSNVESIRVGRNAIFYVARRAIKKGEDILLDYGSWYDRSSYGPEHGIDLTGPPSKRKK